MIKELKTFLHYFKESAVSHCQMTETLASNLVCLNSGKRFRKSILCACMAICQVRDYTPPCLVFCFLVSRVRFILGMYKIEQIFEIVLAYCLSI
jgi:hypothetical protein